MNKLFNTSYMLIYSGLVLSGMNYDNLIKELENSTFFLHKKTNQMGLELYKYLTTTDYYDLFNPEPVNKQKNTLQKIFNHLRIIDRHIKKPLDKYDKKDFLGFMEDVRDGKVVRYHTRVEWGLRKGSKAVTGTHIAPHGAITPHTLKKYVMEFKRFWRVYRQYELHNNKRFDHKRFEWGLNVRPLKVRQVYEDYPYLTVKQIQSFARSLGDEEYTVRTLLSVNLMGRKCEINELTLNHFDRREEGLFIQLPDLKLNSTRKVPVEVFNFVKDELEPYLERNNFKKNEPIFPTADFSFAIALRRKSEKLLGKRISPKTLRKLGVCVAEQLGYDRADVERIGGWSPNSPVLSHYFKRRGVTAKRANSNADGILHKDLTVEVDELKVKNKKMVEEMDLLRDVLEKKLYDKLMNDLHRLVK